MDECVQDDATEKEHERLKKQKKKNLMKMVQDKVLKQTSAGATRGEEDTG